MTDRAKAMDDLIAQDADLIVQITDEDIHTAWTHGWNCGEEAERAKIVAWLRSDEEGEWMVADQIENGEHLK